MPVSDHYLVQYLLQETLCPRDGIVWREGTSEAGFVARVGNVEVALEAIPSRAGSRIALHFRGAEDEWRVFEPLSDGWFGRSYSTSDEQILADLLRELLCAAETQCRQRCLNGVQDPDAVRDRVFRQLLCGETAS